MGTWALKALEHLKHFIQETPEIFVMSCNMWDPVWITIFELINIRYKTPSESIANLENMLILKLFFVEERNFKSRNSPKGRLVPDLFLFLKKL